MDDSRRYRRRGTPDLPMAVYLVCKKQGSAADPVAEYHPETELRQVVSGSVKVQIDNVIHTYYTGDIFTIPANMLHRNREFSADTRLRTLVFSADSLGLQAGHFFAEEFAKPLAQGQLQLPRLIQPGHPAHEALCRQLEQLDQCGMYEPDYKLRRFSVLMNVCMLLLPYCQLSEASTTSDPTNDAVKKCMRYIHNNHTAKLTLADIAQVCHLHPNYLCAVFKEYTGLTVFEYLTHYRVETAAALLKKENLSVSKVAELVGFHSESLFFQKFKAIMGMTPGAYSRLSHSNMDEP